MIKNENYAIHQVEDRIRIIDRQGELLYEFETLDEMMTYLNEGYMKY